jgi:predicted acylesterase/phospholipase RssA
MTEPAEDTRPPPPDRYCDLVMKGGITSGVVYPAAIERLAKQYRFHSIGGTSAGAIAAVVTAAAEYQRRQTGSEAGFQRLARLPQELGAPVDDRTSKLLSLFQPQTSTQRLFRVLVNALNSRSTNRRIVAIVMGFLTAYGPATAAALVLGAVVGYVGGVLAGVLAAVIAAVGMVGAWVYRDISGAVVKNNFGLCTGMTEPGQAREALTPWLHALIQEAAGRRPEDPPLTFGELWEAEGFPPKWLSVPPGAKPRSIDLQVFSTNLAHGRPYIFPLRDAEPDDSTTMRVSERLFFKVDELEKYLPTEVLKWVRDNARHYKLDPGRKGHDPDESKAQGLLELPLQEHMPVLLAARMSLSFPLLFSAVPLWAIDYDRPRGDRRFVRCWFSDGGISSNFPMHLFDGFLPMWPTFGITLEPRIEGRREVYLPKSYREGYGERWNRFDADDKPGISRFGGFLGAIVASMQNWNDNALARMPGVRDRVVRVRLQEHEGGMNMNMEREVIKEVAKRGADASEELLAMFATPSQGDSLFNGWDAHRWVRLNVLLKLIEARAHAVVGAIDGGNPHGTDFGVLVDRAVEETPPGCEEPLTPAQAEALRQLLAALRSGMADLIPLVGANPFQTVPKPELRVRPPL